MPGLLESIFGGSGKTSSSYNKNQLGLINDIIQQIKGGGTLPGQDITQNQGYQGAQGWLNSLFNDPEFFNSIQAPALRQFQEQTVPELANRFASIGSGGATGSTAFRNQLAREGSNLNTNLAAMRTGLQQQGVNQQLGYAQQPIQNIMQMLQSALQPTNNVYQPPSGGFAGPILGALAGGFGTGYGQQLGQGFANQQRYPGQNPSTY